MVKKIIVLFFIFHTMSCSLLVSDLLNEAEIGYHQEYFPIGVWMQDPTKEIPTGDNYAEAYSAIGINTFYGLWKWPYEEDMYVGYAENTVRTLQENELKCYAGSNLDAVNWVLSHPEYGDTFLGYMLGDEPDMFKVNGDVEDQPVYWAEVGMEIRNADPEREIYANFGKGFALEDWPGYDISPGPTKADDFATYVSPLDNYSFDLYPYTDPYLNDSRRGAYSYGDAAAHANLYSEGMPVYGFVEGSAPWKDETYQIGIDAGRHPQRRMDPDNIYPTVWNMIVNGADGIIYFCHDFSYSNPDGWRSDAGLLYEEGMSEAVEYTNQSILDFEDILLMPDEEGFIAESFHESVELKIRVKQKGDFTYIFAMGHGNSDYPSGDFLDGTITTPFDDTISIEVVGESRTTNMVDGVISDSFDPYELHIYKYED